MSRPTTDKKGYTVILRINEETRKYLEGQAKGETLSSYVREMIRREKDGANNVIQNKSEWIHRIKVNAAPYGLSEEELAEKLMDSMDSGKIIYEDGEFTANIEVNLDNLREACHDKGIPVQKAVDTMTQMVRKA